MAKEHNFIHPDLTSFLFLYISCHFQCWLKNIKAKSFNVKIHHRQITNHLNNPILSHLYEVAEFILKFIQRLRPFISRTTINTANDKMTYKKSDHRLGQSYISKTDSHDFPLQIQIGRVSVSHCNTMKKEEWQAYKNENWFGNRTQHSNA